MGAELTGRRALRVACAAATIMIVTLLGSRTHAITDPPTSEFAVHITSPLGRTGQPGKVRIVAQVMSASAVAAVRFFVDDQLVGTVQDGPPFAVPWSDDQPFERRTIVVEAEDAAGTIVRDTVVLPAFEITDRADVTSVLVETSVYDAKGRFASDLAPDAFSVRENGEPQTLDFVDREVIPATIVLLVDNSQSMGRRMDVVRRAVERLASSMRPRDRVIVAPFNQTVGAITGPTDDRATITEAIAAMRAGGSTAIFDSLVAASKLVSQADGRRAIILVTDGYDEQSGASFDDALAGIEAAQATVYVVGVGGVSGISLKGEMMLGKMAERSGGRIFLPPSEGDLTRIADAVAADAHSRYLITYTPHNQRKDGSWRDIAVEVPAGYRVRAKSGYFAPAPPPIRPVLEFTVMDGMHRFVDVSAGDLEIREDGVVQSVDTFQQAVDPVSIVMALDSSGSMKKSAAAVQEAARNFVSIVRPEDSLALITFADEPRFEHVLATNRDWSYQAIDKYHAAGGTALYDALWNSLMHLKGANSRRAVVVLTDGRDENNPGTAPGSEHTLAQVLDLQRTVGATVFAIGLGTKVDRAVLQRLANQSGGEAYFPSNVAVLDAQYRRIVENMRRRYVLSYTSTNSDHDGGWRAVEIRPTASNLSVSAAAGYYAPR